MLYVAGPELHREGQRVYKLQPDPPGPPSFAHWIRTTALDHEGSLWIGTNSAGLHRLKSAPFAPSATGCATARRTAAPSRQA